MSRSISSTATVEELDVDGRTISRQEDLSHYITQFYAKLYIVEQPSSDTTEAQKRCWESMPPRVTEDMNAQMSQELTVAEVANAITSLPKRKTPGHVGLLTEFFLFPRECGRDRPHSPPSISGNASLGADFGFHQQGDHHLHPEIR
jgi:hypothetical protein